MSPQKDLKEVTFTGSKLDFLRFQARHSAPFHLNDGELTLIAYLFLYKEQAVKKVFEDGHFKSVKSAGNYMTTLRGKGVVVGDRLVQGLADLLVEDPTEPEIRFFTFKIVEETK